MHSEYDGTKVICRRPVVAVWDSQLAFALRKWLAGALFFASVTACSLGQSGDWHQQLRAQVDLHNFSAALIIAEGQLTAHPTDLEARGWRGKLLAWQGHWVEAESEYRKVLEQAPDDADILAALADVLLWQAKYKDALTVIDRARQVSPTATDILLRRARLLQLLNDQNGALEQYQAILRLAPESRQVKTAIDELRGSKYEVRVGADGSLFNYSGPAESQSLLFKVRWSSKFSTALESGLNQRFGQSATKVTGVATVQLVPRNWLTFGGAVANRNVIVPEHEVRAEYGHLFTVSNRCLKGLESSYQQHWFWYQGAHVQTVGINLTYYFPKDWYLALKLTGSRSGFAGTAVEWLPSGSSRIAFPIHRGLGGSVGFANGTENFAVVDQIGHISSRTFTGGLKYRYSENQDLSTYLARQFLSEGRIQTGVGLNYGVRF